MKNPYESSQLPENPDRSKYTLEDLEKERQWDSGFGPNNPGAERRKLLAHQARLREIEDYLKAEGMLEMTAKEKVSRKLDELHPNAKSKTVVEHNGNRYQMRYFPLDTSRSGKTVREWGHRWRLVVEKPKL